MTSCYKIVVIGAGGVGKSAFVIQHVTSNFVETYDPTLEDSYRKLVIVDDVATMLNIYDTAGQEDFYSIRDQYIRIGEGFVCMYSITNEATFNHIENLQERLVDVTGYEGLPVVLVANKIDLEHERVVTYEQGKKLADEFGWHFLEASAKNMTNVTETFETITRMLRTTGGDVLEIPEEEENNERNEKKKSKRKR